LKFVPITAGRLIGGTWVWDRVRICFENGGFDLKPLARSAMKWTGKGHLALLLDLEDDVKRHFKPEDI
jgi:hypothetical protein